MYAFSSPNSNRSCLSRIKTINRSEYIYFIAFLVYALASTVQQSHRIIMNHWNERTNERTNREFEDVESNWKMVETCARIWPIHFCHRRWLGSPLHLNYAIDWIQVWVCVCVCRSSPREIVYSKRQKPQEKKNSTRSIALPSYSSDVSSERTHSSYFTFTLPQFDCIFTFTHRWKSRSPLCHHCHRRCVVAVIDDDNDRSQLHFQFTCGKWHEPKWIRSIGASVSKDSRVECRSLLKWW